MSGRGGKRAGAGRKPGATSMAKRDLASKAKEHVDLALSVLAEIAAAGQSESARVCAANAILDRAYGKPIQGTVEIPMDKAPQMFEGWDIERAQPDTIEAD
jgi:enhancing lycopene biosynthesis protein 2